MIVEFTMWRSVNANAGTMSGYLEAHCTSVMKVRSDGAMSTCASGIGIMLTAKYHVLHSCHPEEFRERMTRTVHTLSLIPPTLAWDVCPS